MLRLSIELLVNAMIIVDMSVDLVKLRSFQWSFIFICRLTAIRIEYEVAWMYRPIIPLHSKITFSRINYRAICIFLYYSLYKWCKLCENVLTRKKLFSMLIFYLVEMRNSVIGPSVDSAMAFRLSSTYFSDDMSRWSDVCNLFHTILSR